MLTQTLEGAAEPEEGGVGLVTARMLYGPDAVLPSRFRNSVGTPSATRGALECSSGTRRAHRDTEHAGVSLGDQAPPPRHRVRWSVLRGPGAPTQTRGALVSRGDQALERPCPSSEGSCLSRGNELPRPGRGPLRNPPSQPSSEEESREKALQALFGGAVGNSQEEGLGMGDGGGPLPCKFHPP